jgi:hypothetical protein
VHHLIALSSLRANHLIKESSPGALNTAHLQQIIFLQTAVFGAYHFNTNTAFGANHLLQKLNWSKPSFTDCPLRASIFRE